MIFFDHEHRYEEVPSFFSSPEVERARREIASHMAVQRAEREQTDVPPVWKLSFDSSVEISLQRLSFGRCAFCEREHQPLSPYRYRPPAYADPVRPREGKDSYLWLSFAWSNLFPICENCRPKRPDHFPVTGQRAPYPGTASGDPGLQIGETPTFYFPGEVSQPHQAFEVAITGQLIGRKPRARATIDHFNLNAEGLVEERAESLNALMELVKHRSFPSPQDGQDMFLTQHFGGARYLFLRRVIDNVATFEAEVPRPHSRAPEALFDLLAAWAVRLDLGKAIDAALKRIRREDERRRREQRAQASLPEQPTWDLEHAPIASVSIKTYKSLEEIAFELPAKLAQKSRSQHEDGLKIEPPQAPCLLILGENATGKSSILEAVALACMPRGSLNKLDLDPAKLTLNPEYMGDSTGLPVGESLIQCRFHDGTERRVWIRARPGAGRPIEVEGSADRLPLVFAYGAHRLYTRRSRRVSLRHVDTLFHDDRQISNPEPWLKRLARSNRPALDEVVSALRHIIQIDGAFESIAFQPTGRGKEERCIIRVKKQRPDGSEFIVPQALDIVSSGYRAILALVCDVFDGLLKASDGDARAARMARAIILIDEIEAHLHPRWKLHVIRGLRLALPRATFIISSHDPLCIRGMFNGEVMALNRYLNASGEGLDMPERVERVSGFETVETMTIEQLLTSDLFQLFSTDDRYLDRHFAGVADLLALQRRGGELSLEERQLLEEFQEDIGKGLPYGRDEVTRLVQDAIAEFLRDRRQLKAHEVTELRERAKDEVKSFLRGLVG